MFQLVISCSYFGGDKVMRVYIGLVKDEDECLLPIFK